MQAELNCKTPWRSENATQCWNHRSGYSVNDGIGTLTYLAKDNVFAQGSAPGILIAIYLIATAILMYCPLYQFLGFSTSGPLDRSV